MIVESAGFDLDVLAEHVESHLLRRDQVVFQSLVRRSRVQSVRPPALIQRAVLEDELAVDKQTQIVVLVFADGRRSQADVAVDLVDLAAVDRQFINDVVQIRRAGRPEFWVFDFAGKGKLAVNDSGPFSKNDFAFRVVNSDFRRGVFDSRVSHERGSLNHKRAVQSGRQLAVFERCRVSSRGKNLSLRSDRLHPDGSPQTCNSRVHDSARAANLLAVRLPVGVGRVVNDDAQFLLAFNQNVGDVEAERRVPADVLPDEFAVDENLGFPVAGFKVEKDSLASFSPFFWNGKLAIVDQLFVFADELLHAGQSRFNRIRNENFAVCGKGFRRGVFVDNSVVPKTVEGLPVLSFKLRTRVLRQRVFRADFFRPAADNRVVLKFPRLNGSHARHAQCKQKDG